MTQRERQESNLPPTIGKPATRALAAAGYRRLEQLCAVTEAEIGTLHGIGPKALGELRRALVARGLSFASGSGRAREK